MQEITTAPAPDSRTAAALYGPLQPAAQPDAARTFCVSNETGTGRVTMETVFPGAELCYNDMHLAWCNQDQQPARNVIEINHCRVGRYECSFGENSCCYLSAGDFAVSAATRKKSASCFPLRHYHGITILLDFDALTPDILERMAWFGIDPAVLRQYICTANRCCILRGNPAIEHIFSELYAARPPRQPGYLRLKVLELLSFLTTLDTQAELQQTEYLNQHQAECAKRVAALMTEDLTIHRTIEQLAQEVGLSPTALKTCFRGVYGSSVYAYLRNYRLQTAQKLLAETKTPVAEIARQVGYENPNKFSSAFRQETGLTPTAYRKGCPNG